MTDMNYNKYDSYPTPACARGLWVLKCLSTNNEGASLDQLHKISEVPKATLSRILETLEMLGLVVKDEAKLYKTDYQIVLATDSSSSFDDKLFEAMNYLSKQLGYTAEWYVPTLSGMVMKKTMSPLKERRVWAQEGFVRNWGGEVDAVYRVGKRCYGDKAPVNDVAWTYGKKGKKISIPVEKLDEEINELSEEASYADNNFNENGVRRSAISVFVDNKFVGVLALAECWTPKTDLNVNSSLPQLINAYKDFF
ncbi:helix-turn-helix domain-containing protein [Vibrio sp. SCSIO 43135]|uniref:helix-turn-helix domain-containing protein n=1 Tax=Vibrio sp. SCSIO 43135 TaxID=2819096 RepID=UPI0020762294|nr:helix-turn-helix domain-containing protein [Vibrio sp. SCSIO 43135]USD43236.1 helix-turn-helix domain-containing protein [Vibrio sp. SCSIO 43135]